MAALTYKCPNCGGELIFDPAKQDYHCEYCQSRFSQQELDEMEPAQGEAERETGREEDGREYADQTGEQTAQEEKDEKQGEALIYHCPSCGAQIVTDETTAATFCYYCHNPVVLEGRLSGDYLPDQIIPFAIDRKAAVEQFMNFVKRKKFVPKNFFDENQIEKLCGVYYPYWVYGCRIEGEVSGEATKVRVWIAGDEEFTETSMFQVERRGEITLDCMTKNALKASDKALVEGVLPFRTQEMKKFSMGYLSGFFAKKRDMEQEEFADGLRQEARSCAKSLLRGSIQGYSTVQIRQDHTEILQEDWQYLLLPVWVLTYGGRNGHIYYYAMNGQTGSVCGELPIDGKKLGMFCAGVGLVVTLLCLLAGYLIF